MGMPNLALVDPYVIRHRVGLTGPAPSDLDLEDELSRVVDLRAYFETVWGE
jgi:hypothetical protein